MCWGRLQSLHFHPAATPSLKKSHVIIFFHFKRLLSEGSDKTLQRTSQFHSESSQEKSFASTKQALFKVSYPDDGGHLCENTCSPAPPIPHSHPDSKEKRHQRVFYVRKHQTRYFTLVAWTAWSCHFSYFSLYSLCEVDIIIPTCRWRNMAQKG